MNRTTIAADMRLKLISVAFVSLLVIAGVRWHWLLLYGAEFWRWSWRPVPGGPIFAAMAAATVPFWIAQVLHARGSGWVWLCLPLLMLTCFGMKLASVGFRQDVTHDTPPSLALIETIVQNPDATSYFTDAHVLGALPLRDWIALYPDVMYKMNLHTISKPPGPVMYWLMWIRLFGYTDTAARIGGLMLGALGTCSIPATYLFLRFMLGNARAAFCGASFLTLCPGFVLFFPMFDPAYCMISTALIGFWQAALLRRSIGWAAACGLVLGLTGMMTFNVLVVGLFMAGQVFLIDRPLQERLVGAIRPTVVVLSTAALLLLTMRLVLNYDVVSTFRHATANQAQFYKVYATQRLYPQSIPFDLSDFAFGSGWLSVLLWVFFAWRRSSASDSDRIARRLSWLALTLFATVAITGLLQTETARVWNFMLPLLMIPVGSELARWKPWERVVPLFGLATITAMMAVCVKYIY